MRIGVIGPSEDEIKSFIDKCEIKKTEIVAMLTFHAGVYKNVEIVALYCGVCKVNAAIAAQILIDKFEVTHIIVTGVAGAINNKLSIGDTVISTKVAYHDVAKEILTEYHPWMENEFFEADNKLIGLCKKIIDTKEFSQKVFFGKIVTGEAFITDNGRKEIINRFNPLCVDMETGGIAHVCYVNKIPFIAIRAITDTGEESGVETFESNCVFASKNSIEILKRLLETI
ncbi:5'-methylthioadenosine/S-adenosylhomocysteine nucleosidase [uncultured Clostridium sp.]|uniref:5'-methylthioadenosine/adenosylhomocysteine nucleosidase n=1 Tax=uncultured Clostridium sp. TaxID=59620 RepID=UPI0008228B82|nr:5'-methylthioadenosine/adenosylhomocysteine nucleosidase [uncultured Clostridium sp.]SCK02337.1 5'-methylthioadenosine/S-adenosylhomocysteine nucleosidase [uncultured Clostridium sp.]